MGAANSVILRVATPAYGILVIEMTDGFRYRADLSSFSGVYCYPKTNEDWNRVAPDSSGFALVWSTRFEVHVDQVIALASRREPLEQTA